MHGLARDLLIRLGLVSALAGSVIAVSHHALAQAPRQSERLLVSLVATRDGAMIADDAASYTPFQQHKEQFLTLDVAGTDTPVSLLVLIWDRDAGGVLVNISAIDSRGTEVELRAFTMYPFIDKTVTRVEPISLPRLHMVGSRNEHPPEFDRLELQLSMARVLRRH